MPIASLLNGLLLIAGTILGLLCCEVGLRLSGVVRLERFLHATPQKSDQPGWPLEDWFSCMQADPTLGYTPRPNTCSQDAHGHVLIPSHAPAEAFRLAMVGDSLLATSRLDLALASSKEPPPPLVSIAVPGYSLWQEVVVIERLMQSHPVKRLILLCSLNDFSTTPLVVHDTSDMDDGFGDVRIIPLPDTASGQAIPDLFFTSHLYRALWAYSPALLKKERLASVREQAEQWYTRLSKVLGKGNAKALLLIMPRLPAASQPLGATYTAEEQAAYAAFLSAIHYERLEVLDLHPLLSGRDLAFIRENYYSGYQDKAHPNRAGGVFWASVVKKSLQKFWR